VVTLCIYPQNELLGTPLCIGQWLLPCDQNEIQRQQHEDELLHLRERERQLQEELNMRRTMDAFNQRQIYQLLSDVEQLRRTNREQQDELDRLSTPVKQPESSPQAQESVIAPLPVVYDHFSYLIFK